MSDDKRSLVVFKLSEYFPERKRKAKKIVSGFLPEI